MDVDEFIRRLTEAAEEGDWLEVPARDLLPVVDHIKELTEQRDQAERAAAAYRHWLGDISTMGAHVASVNGDKLSAHASKGIGEGDRLITRKLPKHTPKTRD